MGVLKQIRRSGKSWFVLLAVLSASACSKWQVGMGYGSSPKQIIAIATGANHTCAVVDGGLQCWGNNLNAQLGIGVAGGVAISPEQVIPPNSGVTAVASGENHTCAVVRGGLQCWGSDAAGQLGNGAATGVVLSPSEILPPDSGVTAVAAGSSHTCAIVNGDLKCWGRNDAGQIGNGGLNNVPADAPSPVTVIYGGVTAVAAGASHTCAVVNGGLQCWGSDGSGQQGNGNPTNNVLIPVPVSGFASGVTAVATGEVHTCAVRNGGLHCWGSDGSNQLGNGANGSTDIPAAISPLDTGVSSVAAGRLHTCAVVNGGLQCWGSDSFGQLGNIPDANSESPAEILPANSGVTMIAAGDSHTCAVVNNGIRCWGSDGYGQIGNGLPNSSLTAPSASIVTGITAVAAGESHSCAVVNGGLQCWGSNSIGQLGTGATGGNSTTPAQIIPPSSQVTAVAVGDAHTCAVVNGGLQCWGSDQRGQLGNGLGSSNPNPEQIIPINSGVTAVAAGASHTCAVVNGGLQCWGSDSSGQQGNGIPTGNVTSPAPIFPPGSQVTAVAAGSSHTCAVVNGGLQCWGSDGSGQQGNGNPTGNVTSPASIFPSGSQVIAVAAGTSHTCAVVNGGLQCWGNDNFGQLGNAAGGDVNSPMEIIPLNSGVTAVATGLYHSCAIRSGALQCWGGDSFGQQGNGNPTGNVDSPVTVPGFATGTAALATGANHTCAVANGVLRCWGRNLLGQLGIGEDGIVRSPVAISL